MSSRTLQLTEQLLSHPSVTAVIPATGKPDRQTDNLKAGTGPDLTTAQRDALIAAVA